MAVDVGGSGLRLVVSRAGLPGPVRPAPGARVRGGGIDVPALVADARALLDAEGVAGPDAVCWSMRGLLLLAEPAEVLAEVHVGLGAGRTAVVSDAVANLVGALGDVVTGAVVAAGTGAVAFGTDFGRRWRRVDGWGHLLGDRGSAAWVGLEGLRAALRARDRVAGGSQVLLDAALAELGPAQSWPRRVMTGPDAPEMLASLAPVVTAAAEAGDVIAAGVCVAAGRALGESLLAAAAGLEAPRLTATGGLLAAAPVRAALEEVVTEAGAVLTPAAGGALHGAVLLGLRLARGDAVPAHPRYLHVKSVGG